VIPKRPEIPVSLLLDSSNFVLAEYELSRLNLAANLKRQMKAIAEQIVDALVEAEFARWMVEHKEELCSTVGVLHAGKEAFDFGERANRRAGGAEFNPADRLQADAAD